MDREEYRQAFKLREREREWKRSNKYWTATASHAMTIHLFSSLLFSSLLFSLLIFTFLFFSIFFSFPFFSLFLSYFCNRIWALHGRRYVRSIPWTYGCISTVLQRIHRTGREVSLFILFYFTLFFCFTILSLAFFLPSIWLF